MHFTEAFMQRGVVLALVTVALSPPGAASQPADPCLAQIPGSVQTALSKLFPGYRLPVESDNLQEDVRWNRERGGSGCLGVAVGDYHGTGKQDYALLLASASSEETLFVVATLAGGSWRVERLRHWKAVRFRLYVDTVAKGRHVRSESLEGPVTEPGELALYTSNGPCIESGKTESAAVVYCYTGKRWVHVWTAY